MHGDQLKHWTSGVPCIVASCSRTTHPNSSSSLVPPPSFLGMLMQVTVDVFLHCRTYFMQWTSQTRFEHEFEVLEHSAVAYVKAGAREEGEVMGVVDSLCTNSREIC